MLENERGINENVHSLILTYSMTTLPTLMPEDAGYNFLTCFMELLENLAMKIVLASSVSESSSTILLVSFQLFFHLL